MKTKRKIRVLIVEDSTFFANVLKMNLEKDEGIDVVGVASDAYVARDLIIEHRPDVMTLDVEMPKMTGIEFLKKLMPQYPLPIVMVSAVNGSVFDALNAGAVDFVHKPNEERSIESFIKELIVKIKIASTVNVSHHKNLEKVSVDGDGVTYDSKYRLIAMGASTGGTVALAEVLKSLNQNVPGIVIVQHMPPIFSKLFAERMNTESRLEVKEAEDGDIITKGKAFIAPGNVHIRVKKVGPRYIIKTEKGTEDNKVNGHCPSVDVLFDSVAKHVRSNAIGVILTGMGKDGARGLANMKSNGAITIGQDKGSSVVYGMPKVAYELGAVDYQEPLSNIARKVVDILEKKK
jgi:two-component system chemotaxis response regulator CheB